MRGNPVPDPLDSFRGSPERKKPALQAGFGRYRYGDSNPGFRRERAAS
jgi:hypothetical protein